MNPELMRQVIYSMSKTLENTPTDRHFSIVYDTMVAVYQRGKFDGGLRTLDIVANLNGPNCQN